MYTHCWRPSPLYIHHYYSLYIYVYPLQASFPTFLPQGHILLYNNIDKPGTISRITGVLSEYNINIGSLLVARQHAGSPALSIVVADARIPAEVAHRIAALDGITSVRTASFGDTYIVPPAHVE